MAANIPAPTRDQIEEVMAMTTCYDENLIFSALQAKNNDLSAVINEFFDDPEKVKIPPSLPHSSSSLGARSQRPGHSRIPIPPQD